jgi:hypothetical protein
MPSAWRSSMTATRYDFQQPAIIARARWIASHVNFDLSSTTHRIRPTSTTCDGARQVVLEHRAADAAVELVVACSGRCMERSDQSESDQQAAHHGGLQPGVLRASIASLTSAFASVRGNACHTKPSLFPFLVNLRVRVPGFTQSVT